MNLSMKWLREFVDIGDITAKEFSEAMTMSGSKVESFYTEGSNIKNVVVGKVLSLEPHPNADKLTVCQIDVGEAEPLQIVTAAKNLKEGDVIPVAKDNSVLNDGTKIKKGKLRGVPSNGMLCSVHELGLTTHDFPNAVDDGIFVIDEECELGQDICSAIGLNDTCVEFEITSNRPDCFSVIGLAREAAATFNKELHLHTPEVKGGFGDCSNLLEVNIENKELCKAYYAKVVKNVRVKSSPRWLRERLRAMGVRPINNIVDITNYVMLEYGQPMHAFDARFVKDNKINVRNAKAGEKITTLDGVERNLSVDNLVIADSEKPIAIAGVMGGEYSGIMDDTTTIVFESANFDGSSVRLTAKEHGMRTDASSRYEKGLDPNACLPALMRACELVEILDAGDVMDGYIFDKSDFDEPKKIKFDADWINKFLSTDLSKDKMKDILNKIECKFEDEYIIVPTFRPDLLHKADIAEEIARFYGYNVIASTVVSGGAQGKYSRKQLFERKVINTCLSLGLDEILTYSFISPKAYNKVMMPTDHKLRQSVVITNPLGEDSSIMRTTALPSILDILSKNFNNRNTNAYLFELAKEYIPTKIDELPNEVNKLFGGLYGENVDFFTIKGMIEKIIKNIGVEKYDIVAESNEFGYHPGRCAKLIVDETVIGVFGEIHPKVCENYDISERVYCFDLNLDLLINYYTTDINYKQLPKYPAVSRDLALICDQDLPVGDLEKAISSAVGKILENIKLFDVYQGKQIEKGKKSVAFNIVMRSQESTLTDDQANSAMKKAIKALEKIGAVLRS